MGRIVGDAPVGGGCISSCHRIGIGDKPYFLKYEERSPAGFFATEAAGLEQLAEARSGLRVPTVAAYHDEPGGCGWIVMEWIEPTAPQPRLEIDLAAALARLHRTRGERWGWDRDGFIGRLPQANRAHASWPRFWWAERISPQLERAASRGIDPAGWDLLNERLDELLAPGDADGPSLLHGDLWSGNVVHNVDGPTVIDPACYFGHREVDLAMAELFGGFGRDFYRAYLDVWPLAAGWEVRREIYQLYYLLVHVNLFGAGYLQRTESTLRSILAAS